MQFRLLPQSHDYLTKAYFLGNSTCQSSITVVTLLTECESVSRMLFRMASLSPRTLPLISLFSRKSIGLISQSRYLKLVPLLMPNVFQAKTQPSNPTPMARKTVPFSSASAEALLQNPADSGSNRSRKKTRYEAPESVLRAKLNICSKNGNLAEALSLYKEARVNNVKLDVHHYNVLLYLCSAKSDDDFTSLEKGFEIFNQMKIENVPPNEATFTNASRLAAAKRDPILAFDIIKKMKDYDIVPKLRSYGPALFEFCNKGMANEAYEVDSHMMENEVLAEEPELTALLKMSSEVKKENKVYEMMHRLRKTVRQVSEETAGTIESWFLSKKASEVGVEKWDPTEVSKLVIEGGGGWHGHGWLGKGNWRVSRTNMDDKGVCKTCGMNLVSIDIDQKETENFAKSVAKLAAARNKNFAQFQEWLQRNGPFEAVVDGANLGLANQHVFSFYQIKRVVNELQQRSSSNKLPLVVLHQGRVNGGPAQHPNNKKLLEVWKRSGALYAAPHGSNDDWYWLYAAVSNKCLLVTNDEMRDHLFELLGKNFFPRWKEKHQVRLRFPEDEKFLRLVMPPPYSNVIQESEDGSWHIPTDTGDDLETPRQWICATRMK